MSVNSPVLLQVTIGATATQFTSTATPCRQILIQNNASHNFRVGDSTVSSTKGILITTGGGSINSGRSADYGTDVSGWWVFGTQNDVVDVLYIP